MIGLSLFSGLLAFFFSISSFFTVTMGNHRIDYTVELNEAEGLIWECDIQNDALVFVESETKKGSKQTFTFEAKGEGVTYAVFTAENGDTKEIVLECTDIVNPYNGKHTYYQADIIYSDYINYDENIILTAEAPVQGGYWEYVSFEMVTKTDAKTVNGVCEYDVINPTGEDLKCDTLFTYYSLDGTPLEKVFVVFTLTADGKIEFAPEGTIAEIQLESDASKFIYWEFPDEEDFDCAIVRICGSYAHSDEYGSYYLPEDALDAETFAYFEAILTQLVGKAPVGGYDTIILEALGEGTTELQFSKVNINPIVLVDGGYQIVANRREVLETVTVTVTVDENKNISYEIK